MRFFWTALEAPLYLHSLKKKIEWLVGNYAFDFFKNSTKNFEIFRVAKNG